jgi:hypothetical protein
MYFVLRRRLLKMNINSICYEAKENQIFNYNFLFPNKTLNFPAGWQKFKGHKTARFYWEKDNKVNLIKIRNLKSKHPASICQEHSYSVPVYEKQVWKVRAKLEAHHELWATIKIHFSSHSSSRLSCISLDFSVEPECDYYSGIVTVPQGMDYAMVEIGTSEKGTLWIESVSFKRIFPVDKFNMDAQGRFNINNVESVTRILEPVDVNGIFELVTPTRDFVEDVQANTTESYSTMQDVFHLATYSFCVINQGTTEAVVQMQLSPNGINWAEDPIADDHIDAGQMKILVYNRFARFVRLKYWTDSSTTNLLIYFQGQG